MGEKQTLDCQHGDEYFKQRQPLNKRVRLQGSRKMGCKAHIILRQYILYPDYAILKHLTFTSKYQERRARQQRLDELRADMRSKLSITKVVKYHVSLPTEEAHHATHPTRGAHLMAQRINKTVADKISELVGEGMTEPQEVKRALSHYVNTVLCADNRPNADDRAYYPTDRDLRNHIYKAKKALELSKLDQQNLKLKLQEWGKSCPDSTFYFRPYITKANQSLMTKADSQSPSTNANSQSPTTNALPSKNEAEACSSSETCGDGEEFEQTFLWVHQMQWQKEMLAKYGNTMTLLDATYKTTLYDLALFFVTVRTNAGYMVAAEFLVHSETNQQIEEALNLLKQWNPQWSPTYFMCDYSEAEILAIETAFPTATVYLCDFHREQSWERWVKSHQHGLTDDEASQLLDLLRDCAWACPCHDNENSQEYYYNQAVERLKTSSVWKTHKQVRTWLTTGWLSIPKVCMVNMFTNIPPGHYFCWVLILARLQNSGYSGY